MAWQWAAVLGSAVIATVVGVAVEVRRQREEEREARQHHQELGGSRKKACQQAKVPFHKGMREKEYLQLIPDAEMALVRRLLKRIDRGRGWAPPVAPAQFDAAWNELIVQCASPIGGSWPDQLSTSDLQPARLRKMAALVDKIFLGGVLSKELRRQGVTQLDFVVDEEAPGSCDWISYFHDDNTIHLLRSKWAQQVSEGCPVVCEGALCTSRLQILAHTVTHEMVHALVFHFMPEVDRASEAYLPDERHGPIFKLLNKRVFGHASDSYHHVFQQPRSIES